MGQADPQIRLFEEALNFAKAAVAGAEAELASNPGCTSEKLPGKDVENAHLRLAAAKQTVEGIEALIILRQMKLSGRKLL